MVAGAGSIMQMKKSRLWALITIMTPLLALLSLNTAYSQETVPEKVLVRNVVLFDPDGEVEDKTVNILIVDKNLDLVSEDKISGKGIGLVVNAHNGVLVGNLNLGTPPTFLIFDKDPREDSYVLMDTRKYAVFSMNGGVVFNNTLENVGTFEIEEETEEASWLAYTPPPLAVPLNYKDTSPWNHWETKWFSGLFFAVLALDRINWLSQDQESESQLGKLNIYDGGEIRAFRFGMIGTINFEKPWVYSILAASNSFDKGFEVDDLDTLTFTDWRLDIPIFRNSVLSVGKQKPPFSMERITSMIYIPMQERTAVSDALLASRDVGVVWHWDNTERFTSLALGLFNDWFVRKHEDFDESTSRFISRFTWAPLVSKDESNLLHLGFSYTYSDAEEGFQYGTSPEFNKSPMFVDTGHHAADSVQDYGLELSWRRGPFWLAGEYVRTDVKNAELLDPTFDGYHLTASWVLTDEMRPYNKKSGLFMPIPVARSVYQNGKGTWEISARYSELDLDSGRVEGGNLNIISLGLNWWLSRTFLVSVNYRYIDHGQFDITGHASGLNARILLVLD
jgi:phosphate-selective porin OprO/OprP